ncbi:3-(methylthio)propionyl---CoA ligase [Marchantia polymorpha subsp. ruderalis]
MVEDELPKCAANFSPLTPLTFIERAAKVYPDKESVIYGRRRFTWKLTMERCRRLASALVANRILPGHTVAVVAPNVPAMYDIHFGVPMSGAVLNTINTRLDARTMAVLLQHSAAKLIFVDTEFVPVVRQAVELWAAEQPGLERPPLIHVKDEEDEALEAQLRRGLFEELPEYEDFILHGQPNFATRMPDDEWDSISINYTSGTTSHPKGVVYSHRGAYLNSLALAMDWGMRAEPVYLWTLPMFHANGWCFPWIVAAMGGTNVCLRHVAAKPIHAAIKGNGVTHMCGAPVVLTIIANSHEFEARPVAHEIEFMTAAAPPPAATLAKMEGLGFRMTHAYGLTECYGPALSCAWKAEWDRLPLEERARIKARQGVGHLALPDAEVLDPKTLTPVRSDGETLGEVMIRGHVVMKGYLNNPKATRDAFHGGWFHTGDLGVMHPDGYIELKDRSKDIIISGGENISSIEVESVLYRHPQILEAAVVARPHEFWGETPCAFVTLKSNSGPLSEKAVVDYCREHLPHYMIPRTVVFQALPKTITGKVQKNVLRERAKALGPSTAVSKL